MDYSLATIDELQAEFVRLAEVVASASDERMLIAALIEQRKAVAKAAAEVEGLSDMEKDALKKALESRPPQ